jgi:hypothetical protein
MATPAKPDRRERFRQEPPAPAPKAAKKAVKKSTPRKKK